MKYISILSVFALFLLGTSVNAQSSEQANTESKVQTELEANDGVPMTAEQKAEWQKAKTAQATKTQKTVKATTPMSEELVANDGVAMTAEQRAEWQKSKAAEQNKQKSAQPERAMTSEEMANDGVPVSAPNPK